jgi:hypothetical protein
MFTRFKVSVNKVQEKCAPVARKQFRSFKVGARKQFSRFKVNVSRYNKIV